MPPAAPRLNGRIALTTKQLFGLPVIAAVPVLALFGFFGTRTAVSVDRSKTLDVAVTYPERFRYRQTQPLRVTVRNRGPSSIDTVFVSFDTAYIARFSDVRFDPSVGSAFVVPIAHLAPGASSLVSVELSGDAYGRHRGRIVVTDEGDRVEIALSTFVFP